MRHMTALNAAMLTFALVFGTVATADDIVEAEPPEPFRESFDANANVSGSKLVGLRIGPSPIAATGPFFVSLPRPAPELCVQAITQDGRYLATNPFRVPDGAEAPTLRIASLSRQYQAELSAYAPEDIAVRTFVDGGAACNPGEALNIPYAASPVGGDALEVLVNTRSFGTRARLEAEGALIAETKCETVSQGTRIAYDKICRLTLPAGETRTGELTLLINDGFSDQAYRYNVLIPRVGAP